MSKTTLPCDTSIRDRLKKLARKDENWMDFFKRICIKLELGDSKRPDTPLLTVDMIINFNNKVVLIKRKNPPFQDMYALPGGFVNIDENTEDAAIREAREETGLTVKVDKIVGIYSRPYRDPRGPTVSICYEATGYGKLKSGSDAACVELFDIGDIPKLAFDHNEMIGDVEVI